MLRDAFVRAKNIYPFTSVTDRRTSGNKVTGITCDRVLIPHVEAEEGLSNGRLR